MTAVATSEECIEDKPSLIVGLICLVVCTVLLVISSYISLEMYLIAGGTAIALFIAVSILKLCRKKQLKPLGATLKRLPYELIPFLISMFVIVLSLDYCLVTEKIGKLLFAWQPIFTVGISSFFISNIINNIPMSVLYGAVIGAGGESTAYLQGIYSAIIGSNIGAYFTPVGALAGIMWVSILKRFEVDFSFKRYIAYGASVGFPTLLSALLGLLIVI